MPMDLTQTGGASGGSTEEIVGGAAGTAIGTAIGGPMGGAIGGAIGKALGGLFGKKKGSGKQVVSIAAFPCPKVNDKGISKAWWWADKIAQAVGMWAAYETYKAAKEQYNIGKAYYKMAKDQWDFFYKYYRPLEEQELAEITAELAYKPDYPTAIQGHTHLVDKAFLKADLHRQALSEKYCICADVSQFVTEDILRSTVKGDSDNFARRYAEKLAQEKNDIRWARMVAAASRGRGLLSASTSFASKASGFYGDYARSMKGLSENAQKFRGYISARNETLYNAPRQRIDSRIDVPNTNNNFDAQRYWENVNFYQGDARGGLNWEVTEGKTPFIHSGLDPANYANIRER